MQDEELIEYFWNSHPCGDRLVDDHRVDYQNFFCRYDEARYRLESHIPRCIAQLHVRDKDVLEIGLGQGADSELLIREGACWSGIDLTQESIDRVRTRLALRSLPYRSLVKGSVLNLPFEDGSFDLVYSHGVLHHVPDIVRAQSEIARVLRPGGRLVAMLYAKRSLNYLLSIAVMRRVGLLAMYVTGVRGRGVYAQHLDAARTKGIARYLALKAFVHHNTDGPKNPYSKVYSVHDVAKDFPAFRVDRVHREFMHAPPLPVHGLPGARWLGWHLWVHLVRR